MKEIPRDYCAKKPCANGGTCLNDYKGYLCKCSTGFSGPNCLGGKELWARLIVLLICSLKF